MGLRRNGTELLSAAGKRLVLALLAPGLALGLGACRYNFIPVVPPQVALELPVRVTGATLQRLGERLVVTAHVAGPLRGAYLSVVWFSGDKELGRDSVYLDDALRDAHFELKAAAPGDYRALLLYGGILLRQLDLREVNLLQPLPTPPALSPP